MQETGVFWLRMVGDYGHAARVAHAVSHEQGAEQPGALAVPVGAQDRHGAGADVSQLAGQLKLALGSVTIILPCRNEAARIGACLDSLLGFTDLEAVGNGEGVDCPANPV